MRIEMRRWEDVVVLTFVGEFDTFDLESYSAKIDILIESGIQKLGLNLRLLSFINSAALGYLIRTRKRVEERGGSLVLVQPSPFVAKTLRTLGLAELFPTFDSDVDALRFFGAGAESVALDPATPEAAFDDLIGTGAILFRSFDDAPEEVPPERASHAIGRILVHREDGPVFRWRIPSPGADAAKAGITLENFDRMIHKGSRLHIKLREPLAVKSHFFEAEVRVAQVTRTVDESGVEWAQIRTLYSTPGPDDRFTIPQGAPLRPPGPADSAQARPERPT